MEQNSFGESSLATNYNKIDFQEVNKYNNLYLRPIEQKTSDTHKNDKLEKFKSRLEAFKTVKTLDDAKRLIDATMPVQLERTIFYIGDAKCTIIKKTNLVKICFKSPTEIIIFNFS